MSHGISGEVVIQSLSPLAQCARANATWEGGQPPYAVQAYALFSDEPRIVARTNDSHAEWLCDYPAGTNVAITVWDRTNESIYYGYAPDNIVGEGSSDCLLSNATATHGVTDLKPTSSADSPSSAASSSASTASGASSSASVTPSSSSTAAGAKAESSSTPVGAIVGGVVGGVVGAALLAGLLFWLYRRRGRAEPEETEKFHIEDEDELTPITPFPEPPARDPGAPPPPDPTPAKLRDANSGGLLPPPTPSSAPVAPPSPVTPVTPVTPTHAQDGGPAPPGQLPPMYGDWKR